MTSALRPTRPEVLLVRTGDDALGLATWRSGLASAGIEPVDDVSDDVADIGRRMDAVPDAIVVLVLQQPLIDALERLCGLAAGLPPRRLLIVLACGDAATPAAVAQLLSAGAAGVLDDGGDLVVLFAMVAEAVRRIAGGGRVLPAAARRDGASGALAGRIAADIAAVDWGRGAAGLAPDSVPVATPAAAGADGDAIPADPEPGPPDPGSP
jgi:hypothetical protein